MAIGGSALDVAGGSCNIDAKITATVVMTCVVVASSGLIFGYDIGISGYNLKKEKVSFEHETKHFNYIFFYSNLTKGA